jgi:hypothetical protein
MEHDTKPKIEKLDQPVGPEEDIVIAIIGTHGVAGVGADARNVHAFGGAICLSSGRKVNPLRHLSSSDGTTHQRGELGGLLTAYEWLQQNAAEARSRTILSSSEYLVVHLPGNISQWTEEPPEKRPNHDLLVKLHHYVTANKGTILRKPKTTHEISLRKEAKNIAQAVLKDELS